MDYKKEFICGICNMYFKNPILFPCGCTYCGEHLHDDSAKDNNIKCEPCSKEFNITENEFRPNKVVEKLVKKGVLLNDEEKLLKQSILKSIEQLGMLYEDFKQARIGCELVSYQQFSEMRRQIDLQREKLKAKIDEIALEMIDETKALEEAYKKKLLDSVMTELNLEMEREYVLKVFRQPSSDVVTFTSLKQEQKKKMTNVLTEIDAFRLVKSEIKLLTFEASDPFQLEHFGRLNVFVTKNHSHTMSKCVNDNEWFCDGGKVFDKCKANLEMNSSYKGVTKYSCSICPAFDLCQTCFDAPESQKFKSANHAHFFKESFIKTAWLCDGKSIFGKCKSDLDRVWNNDVSGKRFKCTVCPDFDLCSKCLNSNERKAKYIYASHSHEFECLNKNSSRVCAVAQAK